jgi:hypothetical protein
MHKVWKYDSPLSKKGVSTLANIMKDAKPQQAESDSDMDSQGKAMWSPQLHFAWDLLLRELYQEATNDRVSFKDFWLQVVDRKCVAGGFRAQDNPIHFPYSPLIVRREFVRVVQQR